MHFHCIYLIFYSCQLIPIIQLIFSQSYLFYKSYFFVHADTIFVFEILNLFRSFVFKNFHAQTVISQLLSEISTPTQR